MIIVAHLEFNEKKISNRYFAILHLLLFLYVYNLYNKLKINVYNLRKYNYTNIILKQVLNFVSLCKINSFFDRYFFLFIIIIVL